MICRSRCPHRPLQSVFVKCQMSAIIKIACGAASEEASCIPLPPGRRKLHIRGLLLPFQTVTASLGRSLGIRGALPVSEVLFLFFTGRGGSFLSQKEKEKNGGAKRADRVVRPYKPLWRGRADEGIGPYRTPRRSTGLPRQCAHLSRNDASILGGQSRPPLQVRRKPHHRNSYLEKEKA